jgi:hypothetical protein
MINGASMDPYGRYVGIVLILWLPVAVIGWVWAWAKVPLVGFAYLLAIVVATLPPMLANPVARGPSGATRAIAPTGRDRHGWSHLDRLGVRPHRSGKRGVDLLA